MQWDEAMRALDTLENKAVEIDQLVLRPGPGTLPGLGRNSGPGILNRIHPSELDEFWWTKPERAYFECLPASTFMIQRTNFRGAQWERGCLLIDVSTQCLRIVPMVRCDALDILGSLAGAPLTEPASA